MFQWLQIVSHYEIKRLLLSFFSKIIIAKLSIIDSMRHENL